ncbi:MAG: hypothetical protein AB7K09_01945 [Planctomycetota bacterium]
MPAINRRLVKAAWIIIISTVVGPAAVALDAALYGAPPWTGPEAFVANFHALQMVPPLFGFALLAGFIAFVSAALRKAADRNTDVDATSVMLCTAIYGALVSFNYIANTIFVGQAGPGAEGAVAALSMNNPHSLCWAIEMVAYAFLGIVTWLLAPAFTDRKWVGALLRGNGVISVISALITIVDITWMLSPGGLVAYAAWNLYVVVTMVAVIVTTPREAN